MQLFILYDSNGMYVMYSDCTQRLNANRFYADKLLKNGFRYVHLANFKFTHRFRSRIIKALQIVNI